MLSDPEPVLLRSRVAEVLKGTSESVQDQAVSALMTLLANADSLLLHEAVDCLSVFGVRSRPALPAIEALLRDQDQDPQATHAVRHGTSPSQPRQSTPGAYSGIAERRGPLLHRRRDRLHLLGLAEERQL